MPVNILELTWYKNCILQILYHPETQTQKCPHRLSPGRLESGNESGNHCPIVSVGVLLELGVVLPEVWQFAVLDPLCHGFHGFQRNPMRVARMGDLWVTGNCDQRDIISPRARKRVVGDNLFSSGIRVVHDHVLPRRDGVDELPQTRAMRVCQLRHIKVVLSILVDKEVVGTAQHRAKNSRDS